MDALDYFKENGYESTVAVILDNLGTIYEKEGNYTKSMKYHFQALQLHTKNHNIEHSAYTYNNLGVLKYKTKHYDQALKYFQKSLKISKKLALTELQYEIYINFSNVYEAEGNYKKALAYYKLHKALRDSLYNEEKHRQIADLQTRYETKQKEQQIELQNSKLAQQDAEIRVERLWKYALLSGVVLIFLIVLILYRSYLVKKRINDVLEEKNKNITDSINYAYRIQSAVLPPTELLKSLLPQSFVLYMPKDIVSGDFYWVAQINHTILVAVADCTGHGVPGAFMSMLGFSLLNETVNKQSILEPHLILNELRNKVKLALRQTGDNLHPHDGMDIALCAIDTRSNRVQYAGANQPAIIIHDGKIIRLKPDLMPIGYQIKERNTFTCTTIDLQKGDQIYLYSDGFQDQFNGKTMTRFKSKPFENLLASMSKNTMEEQGSILADTIDEWKGDFEQIDDIQVMGIKL